MENRQMEQETSLALNSLVYTRNRQAHWDKVAARDQYGWASRYYQRRLQQVYQFLVPANQRVLEIGCGKGDLLASLCPSVGVGVDFSSQMVAAAQSRYPQLRFIQCDAHELSQRLAGETFDVVILSDLLNDLWDIQDVLQQVRCVCEPDSRVIINIYNRVWQVPLMIAQKLGFARPVLQQNWLTGKDAMNLLSLAGFDAFRNWQEILLPIQIPLLTPLSNQFLAKLWPLDQFAIANFLVARPAPQPPPVQGAATVSVVVPARNEAGNVEAIFERVPEMGSGTELIFVEGNSTDDTFNAIQQAIQQHPERKCRLMKQDGRGKGDAVRKGFASASGDVLMILDADLTVPPEDLPRFYAALISGKGEFINGVRLVYPMEEKAMQFFNFLGNKFFSLAFTWLLGQSVKDTLCGTKVFWKRDYARIVENRAYFGDFDPFGDFDLLFGAAKLNRRIIDLPIRYKERVYGTTNISRWKHGMLLLGMVLFAARRLKFI
jgi:SAM-dependent methyltransferase